MEQNKYLDPKKYTILSCGFSVRAFNLLKATICNADTTIEELYEILANADLRTLPGVGRKTFNEVWNTLVDEFGYSFPGTKSGEWVKTSDKYVFRQKKEYYREDTPEKDSSQLELHPYNGGEGIGYTIRLNGYRIIIIKESEMSENIGQLGNPPKSVGLESEDLNETRWLGWRKAQKKLNEANCGIHFFGNLFSYLRKKGELDGLCRKNGREWEYDTDGIIEKARANKFNYKGR